MNLLLSPKVEPRYSRSIPSPLPLDKQERSPPPSPTRDNCLATTYSSLKSIEWTLVENHINLLLENEKV